ncbi:Long-chain-fatty-acid--CoA ligase [Methanosarcina horonobensis HB-1 = JCM 15518]|uniref:Long-chain-fatty-acid--CoA ligase n=2 Tax=Methanosarcina horonobensis TaxID=418008 RepID=A0A0E3S7E9_9EURY|nr:class I adenylate-forming enzyme family protein [Methanosarcina horonobensis]AKB77294.1 Long-chain-fatty-acid--CoA ligase [Methanosarcina horonobensis HB-1 = JCM 15518]
MRIDAYITEHARKIPNQIALEEGKKSISYSCLDEDVNLIASSLTDFKHCKFAILAESGIQYIKILMAVYRSDNIAIPLPIELPGLSLERILDAACINGIIVTKKQYLRFGDGFFERFLTLIVVSDDTEVETLRKKVILERNNPELRLVLYTSGTTGTPKGVMLSDKNLISNARSIVEILSIIPKDKAALVISPHHAFGNSIINSHLMTGGSINIGTMNFISSVFSLIESGVSIFYGVPSTYRILLKYPERFKKAFANVRTAASAGGAMDRAIVRSIRELSPNTQILPMYGQTEATARLAYLPAEDVDEFIDTIGKAIPGVTLEVFDSENRAVESGVTGELVARGDNILLGYLNDDAATENRVIDGWLHTGDLAQKLPGGYIRLLGRRDDLIKIGDHRVNPREIEKEIEMNNEVSSVFIVPVSHELMGNAISLMIIPNQGTEVDKIFAFCRKNLPGYLYPREILFIDHLPLSENGKISNRSIIEEYQHVKASM